MATTDPFEDLFKEVEEIEDVLKFHQVPIPVDPNYLFDRLESLNGHKLRVEIVVNEMLQFKQMVSVEADPYASASQNDTIGIESNSTAVTQARQINAEAKNGEGTSENEPIVISDEEFPETTVKHFEPLNAPSIAYPANLEEPGPSNVRNDGHFSGAGPSTTIRRHEEYFDMAFLDSEEEEEEEEYHYTEKGSKRFGDSDEDNSPKRIRVTATASSTAESKLTVSVAVESLRTIHDAYKTEANETATAGNDGITKQFATVMEIFPDADPVFMLTDLQSHMQQGKGADDVVQKFLERPEYPKLKDALADRRRNEELRKFKDGECTAEEFLQMYEDPAKYFYNEKSKPNEQYVALSTFFVWTEFSGTLTKKIIFDALKKHNHRFAPTFKDLKSRVPSKRVPKKRMNYSVPVSSTDIQFYKEREFLRLEPKINEIIAKRKQDREKKTEEAREWNLLVECKCCYDDSILPDETVLCKFGHEFCRECVTRGVDVALGQGKAELQCMEQGCEATFSLKAVQSALPAKNFSNYLQRLQQDELQKANLEDLVSCPFCSFAAIVPNPDDKIFRCLNEDCGKVTCRFCRDVDHLPLKCNEVEKDSEVKMRTFIEDRMNEALIRTCPKCGKRFLKLDGCNLMTCHCGTKMCYVCRQPVIGYDHFKSGKCMQGTDTLALHQRELETGAATARAEYLASHPEMEGARLTHDPMADLRVDNSLGGGPQYLPQFLEMMGRRRNRVRGRQMRMRNQLINMLDVMLTQQQRPK